jgi:hypothetical protein
VADDDLVEWAVAVAASLDGLSGLLDAGEPPTEVRCTSSGALVCLARRVVVKVHAAGIDPHLLDRRLAAASSPVLASSFVPPLERARRAAPHGRWATAWPRVPVLERGDPGPAVWREAGTLLAGLHRARVPTGLPPHGPTDRLARAVARARRLDDPRAAPVVRAGDRVLAALDALSRAGTEPQGPVHCIVHGDWHLGQLAETPEGLRLLDVDDLGHGDPAWDLARPAGFWAAGLLDDASWRSFVDAYGETGGPAVAGDGDPWPRLDLPARAAVVVAAVRELRTGADPDGPVEALCSACARM